MIQINSLSPFKRMCVTVGNLPSSFMESMTYYEALCWLYNWLDKTVIPAINTEGEAITELQNAFTTLENYVNNYFDNLDVQEEINNKLDEMAEAGELTDIIAQYLGLAGMITFNTVAEMKLAENLVNGSKCETLGFYNYNDGGNALYKVRNVTNEDTIDEMTLFALNDPSLVAELIADDSINIKQIGAHGDNSSNDTSFIEKALNTYHNIYIPYGTYLINSAISINNKNDIYIHGDNSVIKINGLFKGLTFDGCNNINIKDLTFTSPLQYEETPSTLDRDIIIIMKSCNDINFNNNNVIEGAMGIIFDSCEDIIFKNNIIHDFKGWGCYFGYELSKIYKALISNNISYNSTYDGIKLTGYIRDIIIENNTCYNNTRDGIDYAGHTAKNVILTNNNCYNNTLQGIDFKQLERDIYPYDNTFDKEFESIKINNNLITNNNLHGINLQLYYNDTNINDVEISNNNIVMQSTENNFSSGGIRIAPCNLSDRNCLIIHDNFVNAKDKNLTCLRLSNTTNVTIENNKLINGQTASIYIDYNAVLSDYNTGVSDLYILNNTLTTGTNVNSQNITFSNVTTPTNIVINNNKMKNPKDSAYNITSIAFGTGFSFNGNSYIDSYDTIPTGRSFKNMIYYASDPITAGCMGWIADSTSSAPTYKVYIPIE